MNQFYREIDEACKAQRLFYNAPLLLKHYYDQEKATGFRGITVYTFPNKKIPEVLQLFNKQYNQTIGICLAKTINSADVIYYGNGKIIKIIKDTNEVSFSHSECNRFNHRLTFSTNYKAMTVSRQKYIGNNGNIEHIKYDTRPKKPIKPSKL